MPSESLSDTVYAHLRSQITRLEIPPGSSFTEGRIAAELGLSKTPVREALTRLRHEGFVTVDTGSGYRAAEVTIKDTRELFSLRVLLEGEAASQAAARSVGLEELRRLEELCSSTYSPADASSVDRFLKANTLFHLMVASASASQRLTQALEIILVQMERLFRIGLLLSSRADEIVHEHRDLLQAILAGDSEQARRVAVDQVRASQRMVVDALVSSDEVTRLPINLPRLKAASDG
jgi:DNA-binding GntR family transcriptional regulator